MVSRSDFFKFIIDEYFDSNIARAAHLSGYSQAKIKAWSTTLTPQKGTLRHFLQCALVPEFRVIAEYADYDRSSPLQTQLKKILGDHANDPGIYAFYDSLGNLVYLGKATKLLQEITSAINKSISLKFPKGAKNPPTTRKEVVRFISAYDVGKITWGDYPKHVESLILRISKPIFNKNIGFLDKAFKVPDEA